VLGSVLSWLLLEIGLPYGWKVIICCLFVLSTVLELYIGVLEANGRVV